MTRTVDAIFAGGVLRPVEPLDNIPENTRLKVTVEVEPSGKPFDGWTDRISDEDAATMRRVIEEEFEQVDPNEWK